jgi:hypothetical protein
MNIGDGEDRMIEYADQEYGTQYLGENLKEARNLFVIECIPKKDHKEEGATLHHIFREIMGFVDQPCKTGCYMWQPPSAVQQASYPA